ncbi:hypothetical protein KSZ_57040 [Dictyobacter formicarum]|uniref:Cation/H+ exchanger transmembrane domain-containing protein n=1 Tax=Dictyobacter formicarum TaxID=2778368 RepID=A0ABQ3VQ20_9CHLR|nr:hypothetical protein KSZ_57040 [Dictyobacter formicarum]
MVFVIAVHSWIPSSRSKTGKERLPRPWRFILFWSGLRGALSLALALAIPLDVPFRDVIPISTYSVVFFTLLVQGLSIRWILNKALSSSHPSRKQQPSAPSEEENQKEHIISA